MRRRQLVLASVLWLSASAVGACGGSTTPTLPTSSGTKATQDYVDALVTVMQQNSLRRHAIDWPTFRTAVLARAAGARTVVEAYPAIRLALELLADNHSFYEPVSGDWIFVSTLACAAPAVTVPELPTNVGYVRVPSFLGSGLEASAFARDLQNEIRLQDKDALAGWIVDLRSNGGGNMWPMIAGVGPVLGEGLAGYFVAPDGTESRWGYRHGASWINDEEAQRVGNAYRLRVENPRVAVLTDNRSNSSGEATVVAFRQRPNTRSFGNPTCGRSTANRAFPLGDGASLYLAVSVMADRTRTMYGHTIVPDEVVPNPDEVVQRAVAWLTAR